MRAQELDLCGVGLAERNTMVAKRFEALAPGESSISPWMLPPGCSTISSGPTASASSSGSSWRGARSATSCG